MGSSVSVPTPEQAEKLRKDFKTNCRLAAKAIAEANFFCLQTGAGFSADSGLAVYKDVADIPPYQKRGLTYSSICVPQWLDDEAALFFGFWGNCFNTYRDTIPHNGYQIAANWKHHYFPQTQEFTDLFNQQGGEDARERLKKHVNSKMTLACNEDSYLENVPGPFFHVTSNVDAHSLKAGFKRTELFEIHGNTETWQCGKRCTEQLWSAPTDYRFTVNQETMLTPAPDAKSEEKEKKTGFETTFPRCKNCNSLARPSILMFCDDTYLEDQVPGEFFSAWESTIRKSLRLEETKKLVVLEIGCGNRVTTIRYRTEKWKELSNTQVTIIRINPDFPLPDSQMDADFPFISIMSRGIVAMTKIAKYLDQIKGTKVNSQIVKKNEKKCKK